MKIVIKSVKSTVIQTGLTGLSLLIGQKLSDISLIKKKFIVDQLESSVNYNIDRPSFLQGVNSNLVVTKIKSVSGIKIALIKLLASSCLLEQFGCQQLTEL